MVFIQCPDVTGVDNYPIYCVIMSQSTNNNGLRDWVP